MTKKNPFSYRIDYLKAIALDTAYIALLTDPMYVAVCETMTKPTLEGFYGAEAVFLWVTTSDTGWRPMDECLARGAVVGLTQDDLEALAHYLDVWTADSPFQAPATTKAYRHGKELVATRFVDWHLRPDAIRRKLLSKARASLAAHKRNAAKYG